MKSGGSILRGQLRPSSGRSPPFLVVCLLIVTGFMAFNYWNLSTEYNDILREYADLQDHMRISILKRENAERQKEALERRLKESDSLVQKSKFLNEQKNYELRKVNEQLRNENKDIVDELTGCKSINNQLNSTNDDLKMIQKKTEELHAEQQNLKNENNQLVSENQALRIEISALKLKVSRYEYRPPAIKVPEDFKEGQQDTIKSVATIASDMDHNNNEQEPVDNNRKSQKMEMNSDITQKSLNNENNDINQFSDTQKQPQNESPVDRNAIENNVNIQIVTKEKQSKSENSEINKHGFSGQEKPNDFPSNQNRQLTDQQKPEMENREDNEKQGSLHQQKTDFPKVIEENSDIQKLMLKDGSSKVKNLASTSTENPEKENHLTASPIKKVQNDAIIQDKGNQQKNNGDNLENLMQPGVPEVEIPAYNKSNDFDNERKEIISLMKPELNDNRLRNYSNMEHKDPDIILGIEMPESVSTTIRSDTDDVKFLKPNSSAIAFESNENLENGNKEEFNSSNINFNYSVKE